MWKVRMTQPACKNKKAQDSAPKNASTVDIEQSYKIMNLLAAGQQECIVLLIASRATSRSNGLVHSLRS